MGTFRELTIEKRAFKELTNERVVTGEFANKRRVLPEDTKATLIPDMSAASTAEMNWWTADTS